MDVSSLKNIERLNYMLGALLVGGAAILRPQDDALGVLVGVVLTCANFSLMRRMVQWWLRTAPERRGPRTFVLVPKMAGVMLVVAVALFLLPVSAIGVLVGFSVFLGSIALETVRYAVAGPARRAPAQDPEIAEAGDGGDPGDRQE